jgi:ferredoxin-like protein FixX
LPIRPNGGFAKPRSRLVDDVADTSWAVHLVPRDPSIPIRVNLPEFSEPAQRYCPAGVYETVEEAAGPRFQIDAQNCVHCKTCDIKDPARTSPGSHPKAGAVPIIRICNSLQLGQRVLTKAPELRLAGMAIAERYRATDLHSDLSRRDEISRRTGREKLLLNASRRVPIGVDWNFFECNRDPFQRSSLDRQT